VRARASVRDALERDPDGTLGLSARPIAYRPLDDRWVAPIAALCHRPRPDLARAVQASDLVLVTVRKDRGERPWSHFGAASALVDNCYLSSRSSCRARAFPTSGPDGAPNIEPRFAARVSDALGVRVGAPDFARYSLAVLASPAYRARFDAALRADYPRVPIAPNAAAYRALVEAGDAIARACASSATAPSTARIDAVPDDAAARIERPRISADEGWIELGPGVRVTAVPRGGLELVLGHVRVVEAWVASRRGRVLDATACREIADVVDRAAAIAAHIARLDALVAPLL